MQRWLRTASTGALPPARSLLRTLWTSSALPHLCLDHQITSSPARVRFVTTPKTLNQSLLDNSIAGKGIFICPSIAGQRLFDQPLPGGHEPVLRAVLGVAYPVGYEVHLRPLLTRLDPVGARLVQHVPVFLRQPRTPHGGTQPSRQPLPQTSITPNLSSLPSAQYRSNSC